MDKHKILIWYSHRYIHKQKCPWDHFKIGNLISGRGRKEFVREEEDQKFTEYLKNTVSQMALLHKIFIDLDHHRRKGIYIPHIFWMKGNVIPLFFPMLLLGKDGGSNQFPDLYVPIIKYYHFPYVGLLSIFLSSEMMNLETSSMGHSVDRVFHQK